MRSDKASATMARWHVADEGWWREVGQGDTVEDRNEWVENDRATVTGGLVVLGYMHGVSRSAHSRLTTNTPAPRSTA